MIKIKNKKAENDSTIAPIIYLIIGIVAITIVIMAVLYYDLPGKFREMIPGFEKSEEDIPLENGDIIIEYVEIDNLKNEYVFSEELQSEIVRAISMGWKIYIEVIEKNSNEKPIISVSQKLGDNEEYFWWDYSLEKWKSSDRLLLGGQSIIIETLEELKKDFPNIKID